MEFNKLIDILKKQVNISENQINTSRECIKLTEEQINKIKNIIMFEPWELINDCEKAGIYNKIAEIIDNELSVYGYGINIDDTNYLIKYSKVSERILKKREQENVLKIETDKIRDRMIEVKNKNLKEL